MGKRTSSIIVIGTRSADHVLIEALSKVESGWRTANISVHCGVWTGRYTAQFLRGELAKFGKEIGYFEENLKRSAELRGGEHYLEVKLVDDGHGRVRAQGLARERLGAKTALEFEFEVERGSLPEMARMLIEADQEE